MNVFRFTYSANSLYATNVFFNREFRDTKDHVRYFKCNTFDEKKNSDFVRYVVLPGSKIILCDHERFINSEN